MAWGCLTTSALRAPWILDATESLNQPRCRPHVRSDEPPSMRATGKRESHRNAARIAGHDQLRTVKLDQSPSDCKLRPRKVSSDLVGHLQGCRNFFDGGFGSKLFECLARHFANGMRQSLQSELVSLEPAQVPKAHDQLIHTVRCAIHGVDDAKGRSIVFGKNTTQKASADNDRRQRRLHVVTDACEKMQVLLRRP